MKTHLHGAKITNIMTADMFLSEPTQAKELHIIYECNPRFAPVKVAFAQKGSPAYLVDVKEAVKAPEFMDRLNIKERARITKLAKLNPPKPDYSQWIFREV